MAIKVVGISGSPRRNGNSEILLDTCLNVVKDRGAEIEKFVLNSMRFVPCQECEDIRKDGRCKIYDDMQKIYPAIETADVVVVSSPIFFGSLPAQIKMMIDRFQCQWLGINVFKSYTITKHKTGVFICVEASERDSFLDNAKSIIKNFFVTIGASYRYEILCKNVDAKGAIRDRKDCIKRAEEIGRFIVTPL
ncbi:MAG: flavodoxin family protein [Candidatus Ratteibacteria bacterium]|nr:flavodoxin family protein [Candidatus Ratteibacteria bacterium]